MKNFSLMSEAQRNHTPKGANTDTMRVTLDRTAIQKFITAWKIDHFLWFDGSKKNKYGHPFHAVQPSPLPILMSIVLLFSGAHIILFLRSDYWVTGYGLHWLWSLVFAAAIGAWIWEVSYEERLGFHSLEVQQGFRFGIILFILSEAMLFLSFFWGFLHTGLTPSSELGGHFPPLGVVAFYWWRIPLLNTLFLLSSGLSLTIAHKLLGRLDSMSRLNFEKKYFEKLDSPLKETTQRSVGLVAGLYGNADRSGLKMQKLVISWLFDTVVRGVIFLWLQGFEFITALFVISESVYASAFYSLTGLHGLHVFLGALLLLLCFRNEWVTWQSKITQLMLQQARHMTNHLPTRWFTYSHRTAFDGAAWYWHFVDVVWVIVFILVYWRS